MPEICVRICAYSWNNVKTLALIESDILTEITGIRLSIRENPLASSTDIRDCKTKIRRFSNASRHLPKAS
ncbi:hypothetical protein ES703_40297 [subsurface metagenome]